MPLDPPKDSVAPLVSRPHRLPRAVLLTGVAGACVLGAGLGLWARPTGLERELAPRGAKPAAAAAPTPRRIQIRVDGAAPPAPPAAPADTPPPTRALAPEAPPPAAPEAMAPKRAPDGLMRVHAVAPLRLADAPTARPQAAPSPPPIAARAVAPAPADRTHEADKARADKARAEKAKSGAARKAQAEHQAQKAREAEKARQADEARAARKAQAAREARVEAAAAARRREAARLHQLRAEAEAQAERKRAALRLAQAKAEARQARLRPASSQTTPKRGKPEEPVRLQGAGPAKVAQAPSAEGGQLRLASARGRCASADPAAALVCSDPALGAADRQLARAYRDAQAAGVPSAQLERQQQRWLSARANAARQAPWAVHDVYLARIAELQDATRRASRGE